MDLRQFMSEMGWRWKEVQRPVGQLAILECPFCHEKGNTFAINFKDGAYKCMRLNKCNAKGSFTDLQRELGLRVRKLNDNNMILNTPIKYEKPKVKTENNANAIDWLKKRGIWEATSEAYKIGQRQDWIMFQYFKNGELVNVKYRNMKEKKFYQEKNCEPILYGRDFCKGQDVLYLVEGECDCLAMSQYGYNVASIPSGASDTRWIETEWDFLETFQKIYLVFDVDEAGQKYVEEIVKRLGRWRCYNVILPFKDANECLIKDVSEEKIKECIDNAKNFDPPTLRKAIDFLDDIIDLYEHPEKLYGIATPWEGLTKIVRGWRDYELTVWSGRSGSGKSTMINEVIYSLVKKGHKCIIASLEMMPGKYLKWMLSRIKQKHYLEKEDVESGLAELKDLYILNMTGDIKAQDLFDVFDFAARKYGVKHFFVDSLMKVDMRGNDKNDEQKRFCNQLIDSIAKKYNGHVHLVAHPRKGFKDTDKPDKMDVAGSGDITNLADNVFVLYRVSEVEKKKNETSGFDSADNVLSVVKNREWGVEKDVNFKFNSDTKTFTEC